MSVLQLQMTCRCGHLEHFKFSFRFLAGWGTVSLTMLYYKLNYVQAFLSGVAEAVAAHSTAAEKCELVAQLPSAGVPVQLCELADGSLARAAGAQVRLAQHMHGMTLLKKSNINGFHYRSHYNLIAYNPFQYCIWFCLHDPFSLGVVSLSLLDCLQEKLVTCLKGVLRQRLEAFGWPPPLTLGVTNGSRDEHIEHFQGFEQADPQACSGLEVPHFQTPRKCNDLHIHA